ncbi:hypothetical protein ACFSHR_08460 [Azotobacter chroococcum]
MREWQLTRLPEMGVRVGDAWPYLVDPDNEHLALPRPELYVDQLHLNGIGAPLAVRAVAHHFIDLFGVPLELPTYDSPFDATYNPRGWLTSNPCCSARRAPRTARPTPLARSPPASAWLGRTGLAQPSRCSKNRLRLAGTIRVSNLAELRPPPAAR